VIGKLNYLEQSTCPDISYAVHQCAHFSAAPMKEHGQAVTWIGQYLLATRDKGLILRPTNASFDCYVDADFSGNWDKDNATNDSDTACSRSGYVALYNGCPVFWKSKLQTMIALSSTESEYISLSSATRKIIPVMGLLQEMIALNFDVGIGVPTICCQVFEDNSGALELASNDKFRPQTKHINIQYHHFRSFVNDGSIKIKAINTTKQPADMLTKPISAALLQTHRQRIMGW
jgi:hypothetical protein